MEVIKYGLEPAVFVDGLCIAIDLGVDTPKEYIINALFLPLSIVESGDSQTVMGLYGCHTGRRERRIESIWATLMTKDSGHKPVYMNAFISILTGL